MDAESKSSIANRARIGKIARCPFVIRVEVNQRIRDGQTGADILSWLNAQPAVKEMLKNYFHESPIIAQNLSKWRHGGYLEWEKSLNQPGLN